MENNQESLVWISQQSDAKQRIREGGGAPGLARIEQVAGKSGLEILEAMMSGQLPYPPMNETMNMTLLEVDNGRAVFQGIPLRQHYNPPGTVHGAGLPRFWTQRLAAQCKLCCQPGVPTRRPKFASILCGRLLTRPVRCARSPRLSTRVVR